MTFVLFVHRQQRKTIMDPYERLVAINEALQEAMKPMRTSMAGDPDFVLKPSTTGQMIFKQGMDTHMMGALKTMATGRDMTNKGGSLPDTPQHSAKRVAMTKVGSRLQDTARALKKRGGLIGGTKTGRRLAIVGQRVASRLGLTPKADAAAKKKALNRRINKKAELRKEINKVGDLF